MQHTIVMTLIGPDKPGLVESVSSIVAGHRGNWLESRMSRLGGYFAGILRVDVPAENRPSLVAALQQLRNQQLEVVVHEDTSTTSPAGREKLLELVGQDRPGIVRQITQVLARHGINVEELETETSSAAMSGETLFHANARVMLPPGCKLEAVRAELERIAADLIVDISFHDLQPGKAT